MMAIRTLAAIAAALAAVACSPGEEDTGTGDAGCTVTSCTSQCVGAGLPGGTCHGDVCVCGETDGGTDGDATDRPPTESTGELCDVDILFVYDTSGSMMDAVGPLTSEAFPAFADSLAAYPHLGTLRVAVKTNLFGEHAFENGGVGYSCEGGVEETVQTSLFLTQGWDTAEPHDAHCCEEIPAVDCAFASGQRWIEGPSGTMLDEFACVADVPCQQDVLSGEPTLEAGLRGLQHDGNAGFLRDGAVLLVVFITDEEDQSAVTPAAIHDGLLALKGGDERYVAVVTIAGPREGTVEVNPVTHAMGCEGTYGGTEETPEIIDFSALFGTRGVHYEMCGDNDMSGALQAGFDVLELSCDEVILI
jgi:hypothetical protein